MGEKVAYLWKKIEDEDIEVKYKRISHTTEKLNGLYLNREDTGPIIILDTNLLTNERLHRCVLAEEVGHHFTAASTNLIHASKSYADEIARSKDEQRAMRWAVDIMIPDIELTVALEDFGYRSCYELAEHFNVTMAFMMSKLTFLKQCFRNNGLRVKGKQLYTLQHVACRW